jgi:hypothetical protein
MIGPMRNETATVDETTFMGGGYARITAGTCKMGEENPILIQMLLAAPMLAHDVTLSPDAKAIMKGKAYAPVTYSWDGRSAPLRNLFPLGVNWYHNGMAEAQHFGRILVYDPANDAEGMLFGARFVAMLMTLVTTVLVFVWGWQLTNHPWTGVMAASLWAFNPLALAYGHLAITEPGIALFLPMAVWWFVRTVNTPTYPNVAILGMLSALAMEMKFLALFLGPIFLVLLAVRLAQKGAPSSWPLFASRVGCFFAAAWGTILVIYFPSWSPPPWIATEEARALGIPTWFQSLRPALIPGDFFKAVALKIAHARLGQDAFLNGEWSRMGWWYYYPMAMIYKTPLLLLVLAGTAAGVALRHARSMAFEAVTPWVASVMFLLLSMTSTINIGVRHMLPVYPMLAVGIAVVINRCSQKLQYGAWLATGSIGISALVTYPDYIPACNLLAGGTANGYQVLVDSNYDWGQDGKRLMRWMEENHVSHVYLDFFGTQTAIGWHQIPNTHVTAEEAKQINKGWLVVSVSQLMRPEWSWLRESRQPNARIGHTLFAYRLS